ncbi:MAG: sterol desaturase family protein [Sphingobacteriaceae bacterium]|nr:sterol desaturase family protein [Sphingobacteriaceae bacterium]
MNWLVNIFTIVTAFIGMEAVAWLAHKYIMHGLLWNLHRDHHEPHDKKTFEKNDYFFVIFAFPAIICFIIGFENFSFPFWIGIGITLYGAAYFFIHDLFIHQRLKVLRNANSLYFRAIRKAHKIHHKHLGPENGECFGMLWAPIKYFKEVKKNEQ